MFDYKYLEKDHLVGFDNYKYHAMDTSPLSKYIMHPFWNKAVQLVPRWVAPNVLTFVGFLLTVLDFLILSWYDYDFYAASAPLNSTYGLESSGGMASTVSGAAVRVLIPGWCWLAISFFLFLAYTLDGIDGKQARRTQTSGPLGELFDHGLDSYSVFFIPVCLYSAYGRLDYSIPPIRMYFILWSMLFNFFISHLEKYNTGVLFLPWGYDLSMWGACAVFLVTGLCGMTVWKTSMAGFTLADMFEMVIYGTGLLTNVPVSAYNVYVSYKKRSGMLRSPLEAVRPVWSVLAAFTITTLWVLKSPGGIIDAQPRMFYLMVGTVFSNICCRLIVAQMSGQRCEALSNVLAVPALALAASLAAPAHEQRFLRAATAACVLVHVHYGTCVLHPIVVPGELKRLASAAEQCVQLLQLPSH